MEYTSDVIKRQLISVSDPYTPPTGNRADISTIIFQKNGKEDQHVDCERYEQDEELISVDQDAQYVVSEPEQQEELISLDQGEQYVVSEPEHINERHRLPTTPMETIMSISMTQKEGNNTESSVGRSPRGNIPVFPETKQLSVDSGCLVEKLCDTLKSKNYDIRSRAVEELENRIIISQGKCPEEIVDNLRTRTFQLNASEMSDYLQQPGIFDHAFQDGTSCLVDALTTGEDSTMDLRLRKWITELEKIEDTSAGGAAYLAGIKGSPLFVIKIQGEQENLSHEAVVGMGAINKLRHKIPNFVHTYAAFMCSPPILDDHNQIMTFCPRTNNRIPNITHIVMENINNSLPMAEIIGKLSTQEFLQIYLQILNALNVAFKAYDFTHYDLHLGNILIQELTYYVAVPFYDPQGDVKYINTKLLPRIIDYGFSHVYLQGQHFGKFYYEDAQIYPEKSFPMHDAYKVLLSSYNGYQASGIAINEQTYNMLNSIYGFFGENQAIQDRYRKRGDNPAGDYYQPTPAHINKTIDQLLIHMLSIFELPFLSDKKPEGVVLTVCTDKCVQWDAFNNRVFDGERLPETLADYCQANRAIDNLTNGELQNDMKIWISQFNVDTAYSNEISHFIDNLNCSIDKINNINIPTFNGPSIDMNEYSKITRDVIAIMTDVEIHKKWLEYTMCSFDYIGQLDTINEDVSSILVGINQLDSRIYQIKEDIIFNMEYVESHTLDLNTEIKANHLVIMNKQ